MATLTTSDGLNLYFQQWAVENPKAVVLLVHGYGEHIGRYEHVATGLNEAGYSVTGIDHRLHGKSEGTPRAYVTDIDLLVDDLKILWDNVKAENPGKPLFMIGHSMGGLLAIRFTLRYQHEMQGLVTSGAGLISHYSIPTPLLWMVQSISKIAPKMPVLKIPSRWLSTDPQIPVQYDNDPLNNRGFIKARTLNAMVAASEDALEKAPALKLPLLILHGGADKVVLPKGSQVFYERAGSQDKTLRLYPGLYHEIFNEVKKQEIIQTVLDWLDAHLFASNGK